MDNPTRLSFTKGLSLFIAVLLTATIAPQCITVRPAAAVTDGYPWATAPCAWNGSTTGPCSNYDWGESTCPTGDGYCTAGNQINGYYQLDQWGESFRNCVSYTAWKLNQVFAINTTNWGSGADWNNSALAHGYTDDSSPQIGDIAQWNSPAPYGHVAYVYNVVNGVAYYAEYNYAGDGNFLNSYTSATQGMPTHFIHIGTVTSTYPDGTYLHATDSGGIYVVAGGAAMYVSSWANVGGSHPYTDTTQSVINSMPTYPRDGTYIHAYTTGGIYVVAGGAPMYVSSWTNVGGSHPTTDVDVWVITNQLRQYPLDGTYIHAYTTGGIYVVAGGAPMYVSSWANVGGTHPTTDVDVWVISNQLRQYPLNGTYIRAYTTGGVYVVAGGAPMYVSSWTTVGGTHPDTDVDAWVLTNQLRQHPSDGTYVQPYGNAAIYEAAGSAALSVSTWSAVGGPYPVTVIPSDSLPQFLSYPQDGTYVKGYQSGEEFEAMSGAVTRITTTPLPPATSVDDWAIINQLGGVE